MSSHNETIQYITEDESSEIALGKKVTEITFDGVKLLAELKRLKAEQARSNQISEGNKKLLEGNKVLMEEVLTGNEIMRTTQKENRESRSSDKRRARLGYAFLSLGTIGVVAFCFWAIPQINWFKNRLINLPSDTSALQKVFALTGERKFQVGHIVLNQNGEKMVVLGVSLSDNGWLYKLKKLLFAGQPRGYVVNGNTDYYRLQQQLGPVMYNGANAFFDMKKIEQKVTDQSPTTSESAEKLE